MDKQTEEIERKRMLKVLALGESALWLIQRPRSHNFLADECVACALQEVAEELGLKKKAKL